MHLRQSLLFLVLLALPLSPSGNAQTPPETATKAIQTLLNEQREAWNRGDIRAFMSGYWNSPDLTFSGSSGTTRGWQAVLDRYLKTYPDTKAMGYLDFTGLEIRLTGPRSALVLGNWHLTRQQGDIGGVFSLVLEKFESGWRIIHDHTSAVNSAK